MIFHWLRRRRRARILAQPFPPNWLAILESRIADYALLSEAQQAHLRDEIRVFVAEKNWEGCGGLELTDEMKVVVAALASLMVLELDGDPLKDVPSILIYPAAFKTPKVRRLGNTDFALVGEQALEGEAVYRGAVVLNWGDIELDLAHHGEGNNLVWHEFAHQLDMLDRSIDGTPPLRDAALRRRWHEVMTAEYRAHVAARRRREPTFVHAGAAENPGEFFAYATECFFDAPVDLRSERPALYALLSEYYRQDPAARFAGEWG